MINPRNQDHEPGYVSPTEHSMMRWAFLEVLRARKLVDGVASEVDDDKLLNELSSITGVSIELGSTKELPADVAAKRLRDTAGFILGLEQPIEVTEVVHAARGLNAAGLKV